VAGGKPKYQIGEFMPQSNPYDDMIKAKPAPTMSVVSKALAAFSKTGIDPSEDLFDPMRAKALLKKIFGEEAKFVKIKAQEPFDPAIDNPVFVIDEIELDFQQGTTPEEDIFKVTFAGVLVDMYAVRTLEGLGAAITASISLAEITMKNLTKEEMERHYREMFGDDEDDLLGEDDLDDEDEDK
jgi:hypothetical protein